MLLRGSGPKNLAAVPAEGSSRRPAVSRHAADRPRVRNRGLSQRVLSPGCTTVLVPALRGSPTRRHPLRVRRSEPPLCEPSEGGRRSGSREPCGFGVSRVTVLPASPIRALMAFENRISGRPPTGPQPLPLPTGPVPGLSHGARPCAPWEPYPAPPAVSPKERAPAVRAIGGRPEIGIERAMRVWRVSSYRPARRSHSCPHGSREPHLRPTAIRASH